MKTFEKKIWKRALLLGLLTCFTLFSSGQDLQKVDPRTQLPGDRRGVPEKIVTRADLSVVNILAGNCPCSLAGLDAIHLNTIIVDVNLKDITKPVAAKKEPSTVVGHLIVTYFDLIQGREITQNLMLERGKFNGVGDQSLSQARITVFSGPLLVKKSSGIRAIVKLNIPGYADVDPDDGNNLLTVHECRVLVL